MSKKAFHTRGIILILAIMVLSFAAIMFLVNYTGVVGNKKILDEIIRLDTISEDRNLTASDLEQLKRLTKNDYIASSYVKEVEWLIGHGYATHSTHGFGYLFSYVQTGQYRPCVPHVLAHATLYYIHGDEIMGERAVKDANEYYDKWYYNTWELYKDNDAKLSQLKEAARESKKIIETIESGQIDISLQEKADELSEWGLC